MALGVGNNGEFQFSKHFAYLKPYYIQSRLKAGEIVEVVLSFGRCTCGGTAKIITSFVSHDCHRLYPVLKIVKYHRSRYFWGYQGSCH